MSAAQNPDEFYTKLKAQLSDTSLWPAPYLFKFIVPSSDEKIKQICGFFDHEGAVIDTKESRTGKYTSVSINVKMKDPDAVIEKYKEVAVVEGVISL
jgi:putative lipoic acid-binding regulatory protein